MFLSIFRKYWMYSWLILCHMASQQWMMKVLDSSVWFTLVFFFVRTGCPHLPSPQTQSSAESSAQRSLGHSLVRSLENKRHSFTSRVPRSRIPAKVMCTDSTWHFEASKWHLHGSYVVVVDETGTSFQAFHHAMGSHHIPTQKSNRSHFVSFKSCSKRVNVGLPGENAGC